MGVSPAKIQGRDAPKAGGTPAPLHFPNTFLARRGFRASIACDGVARYPYSERYKIRLARKIPLLLAGGFVGLTGETPMPLAKIPLVLAGGSVGLTGETPMPLGKIPLLLAGGFVLNPRTTL